MSVKTKKNKVLLIDDERSWVKSLSTIIQKYCSSDICVFSDYDAAENFLDSEDLADYHAVIIDVKLREQVYDQGGLALLNIVKQARPQIPVLMLTAYAYDYPGLREITDRYQRVFTYDKETFTQNSKKILDMLFLEQPPQIGDTGYVTNNASCGPYPITDNRDNRHQTKEIILGAKVITLIIASATSVFLLFQTFSEYTVQINVIFSIVIITLICVLLRIFKPSIVQEAVKLYQTIVKKT